MKNKKLVVLGAPSFMEFHTLVRDINRAGKEHYEVIAILDDNSELHGKTVCGTPVAGPLEMAKEYGEEIFFVLCIQNFALRIRRMEILQELGLSQERFPTFIHPSCVIGDHVKIGAGTHIYPFASIKNFASIGNFSVFFEYFATSPCCTIGDGCLAGGYVSVLAHAAIEPCVFLGQRTTVSQNIRMGAASMAGAHSLVTKNIFPGHFTLGNPATKQIPNITLPDWLIKQAKNMEGAAYKNAF